MQTITKYIVLLALIFNVHFIYAQEEESNKAKIELLEIQKEKIETQEREYLKKEVEAINQRLDKGEITMEEADALKKEAAENRALNIENRIAIIDNKISLLKRNEEGYNAMVDDGSLAGISISDDETFIGIRVAGENKPRKYDRRTTNDFVAAIGFNNAIIEGESLNDSPYKLGGSGFVELGWAWKTRVFNNSNAIRLKYGFSFQWNKLHIKGNKYLNENEDGLITLEEFPDNVRKSKFRTTNLVLPVHFEFGPSRKIERDDYFRYSTHKQFKIGIGGYGGFNIASIQKVKYTTESGKDKKDKYKNYNTNNFVYGLSCYMGWDDIGLYFKYDLSPIFNNQAIDQNNISLGIRFDLD